MKAKKLISIVLLAAMGGSAQAQIVSSQSDQIVVTKQEKKPRTLKFNIRAGYSFDSMTGEDDLSGSSGFDFSFGISAPFRNSPLFWGVEAGVMSYGACMKTNCVNPVISFSPRIGFKFPIGQKMSLNLYGGPYLGYHIENFNNENATIKTEYSTDELGHKYQLNDMGYYYLDVDNGIDVGINIGAEFFVTKNIFFDLHVRKGFLHTGKYYRNLYYLDYDYDNDEWISEDVSEYTNSNISALKIVLGIGVQF